MDIQLMTDGGADLPKRLREELDVAIVPLYLHFEDGEYKSGVTIDLPTFLKKVRDTKKLTQSSSPSPTDLYESSKKDEPDKHSIMVNKTKRLSSTYERDVLGKQMLLEEQPHRTI